MEQYGPSYRCRPTKDSNGYLLGHPRVLRIYLSHRLKRIFPSIRKQRDVFNIHSHTTVTTIWKNKFRIPEKPGWKSHYATHVNKWKISIPYNVLSIGSPIIYSSVEFAPENWHLLIYCQITASLNFNCLLIVREVYVWKYQWQPHSAQREGKRDERKELSWTGRHLIMEKGVM